MMDWNGKNNQAQNEQETAMNKESYHDLQSRSALSDTGTNGTPYEHHQNECGLASKVNNAVMMSEWLIQ